MDYNAGFARANNEGIRQSTGSSVLLLNADTLIERNAISDCYKAFADSDYLACGVQLVNPDRTPQISGNQFMIGGLNYLLPLPYLGNFFKWIASVFSVQAPNVLQAPSLVEVDWINGAFLMVKKTAIAKAGLMDEDFFLYAEEAEWCYRIRKVGKLCLFGNFQVVHLQGETSNKVFGSSGKGYFNLFDRRGLQIMLSNFVRIRKQFGVGWFLLHLLMYTFEIPVFFVGNLLSALVGRANLGESMHSLRQLIKHVFFIWGMSPKILSNKPWFYKVL